MTSGRSKKLTHSKELSKYFRDQSNLASERGNDKQAVRGRELSVMFLVLSEEFKGTVKLAGL